MTNYALKEGNGLGLLSWPSRSLVVPGDKITEFSFYLEVTIDSNENLKFRSSSKTLKVECGPKSTTVIQSSNFPTKVIIEEDTYEFANFKSTNSECPIIDYRIVPEIIGITLSTSCSQ